MCSGNYSRVKLKIRKSTLWNYLGCVCRYDVCDQAMYNLEIRRITTFICWHGRVRKSSGFEGSSNNAEKYARNYSGNLISYRVLWCVHRTRTENVRGRLNENLCLHEYKSAPESCVETGAARAETRASVPRHTS